MTTTGPWQGPVQIRDVQDSDLEQLFEHQLDPEATRMAAFPARDRDAFMAHWATIRADRTVVAQTVVAEGIVVGNVVSWEQSGRRLVGYWLGRDHWGRGIATRALALYLDRVTVRPLHAYVAVENAGSIRALEKCGFRRVAEVEVEPGLEPEVAGLEALARTMDDGVQEVLLVLA